MGKILANMEKKVFTEQTFTDCSLMPPKNATPPNFVKKTFMDTHKTTKFTKNFSLESFPLYGTVAIP